MIAIVFYETLPKLCKTFLKSQITYQKGLSRFLLKTIVKILEKMKTFVLFWISIVILKFQQNLIKIKMRFINVLRIIEVRVCK